jgi:hypothetical protein
MVKTPCERQPIVDCEVRQKEHKYSQLNVSADATRNQPCNQRDKYKKRGVNDRRYPEDGC